MGHPLSTVDATRKLFRDNWSPSTERSCHRGRASIASHGLRAREFRTTTWLAGSVLGIVARLEPSILSRVLVLEFALFVRLPPRLKFAILQVGFIETLNERT